jgi:hypothetical protein
MKGELILQYIHACSGPFKVTDQGRFENLAQRVGLHFVENLFDGTLSIEVSGERMLLLENPEQLNAFLVELRDLVDVDFRLTVSTIDTGRERPIDVVVYRIWAGKVWAIWLDALESGFCRKAIDSELWANLEDFGQV